jgi:hypothetical protein
MFCEIEKLVTEIHLVNWAYYEFEFFFQFSCFSSVIWSLAIISAEFQYFLQKKKIAYIFHSYDSNLWYHGYIKGFKELYRNELFLSNLKFLLQIFQKKITLSDEI